MYKKLADLKIEHNESSLDSIKLAPSRALERKMQAVLRKSKHPASNEILVQNMQNKLDNIFK